MAINIAVVALNDSTPVQLDALAGVAGRSIIVDNIDESITVSLVTSAVGFDAETTPAFQIISGAHLAFPLGVHDHVYAVSASGTPSVDVLEVAIGDIEDQ